MSVQPAHVYVAAACRTPVAPRNGAFAQVEAYELAARVLQDLVDRSGLDPAKIDQVILGNALYAGGNPARVAALAAGIPVSVPAITIDSQCCSGLDSIIMGASLIASCQADAVIVGGLESYSRAPLRYRRPKTPGESEISYDRPPFTPWPDIDPDMISAAAALASELDINQLSQQEFAIASHAKALTARSKKPISDAASEIVSVGSVTQDAFTRHLSAETCRRLPNFSGSGSHALNAATIAVEADAAAAVLLVSRSYLRELSTGEVAARYVCGETSGGDPRRPGLAPIEPARAILARTGVETHQLAAVEIMEAFAVQAMAFVSALDLSETVINRGGGALARGHPIGASGAILAVRLFHELQKEPSGAQGLAAIAAAGGLGSAILMSNRG